MLNTNDLHWLAGLIEGEGSFGYYHGSPRITVAMTDRDVIERASSMVGFKLSTPKLREKWHRDGLCKQMYVATANGIVAAGWMMTLYPLMGARRKAKIAASIALWKCRPAKNEHRARCKRGHPLSEENTYSYPAGTGRRARRGCRECRRECSRTYYLANRRLEA